MEKSKYASPKFNKLKECVLSGDSNNDTLIKDCESFISDIIFNGMNSYNTFYQAYCSYATALGVSYVRGNSATMYVSFRDGVHALNINAEKVFKNTKSEYEVLFIVAHEVKHLLYRHLIRYGSMFSDDVVRVFLNMATDVEVNESLISDVSSGFGRSSDYISKYIPNNCFGLSSLANVLGMTINDIDSFRTSTASTPADRYYILLNNKCEKTLGYSIPDILYRIRLNKKTTFSEEVFKVADGFHSDIFNIVDCDEASRFCRSIAVYLERCITCYILVSNGSKGAESNGVGESNGKFGGIDNTKYTALGVSSSDVEDMLSAVEEFQKSILQKVGVKSIERGRSGLGSGGQEEIELYKYSSQVPWQSILRKYMNYLSNEYISSKKRINRRQPQRLELSGKKRKRSLKVVFAIDESASISNEECSYCMSEVSAVVSQFDCDVYLCRFTTVVESLEKYNSRKAKKKLISMVNTSYIRFTGGTSFQPVFDMVNSDSSLSNADTVVIILTDGRGESDVDFGKVKNRIWVVVGTKDKEISCPENPNNIFPIVNINRGGI